MGTLEYVVRYPVKGLRGERLDAAALEPDRGLAYDRAFGIETGSAPSATGWAARESFFHLARDTSLIDIHASVDESRPALLIEPPDASSIDVRLDDAYRDADFADASRALAAVLPEGRHRPRLTMPSAQIWDWPDANLSIINLDTLDELGRRAGRRLDPRRFRANLYVSGLGPWGELDLLGRRVRIGSATLEVTWPTDRCRATTIDPETGDTELNLPALLASQVGHMFCGVYARVVDSGTIEAGASITPVDTPRAAAYRRGADSLQWPRRASITATVPESDDVVSFWIRDPLGFSTEAQPGQHLRLHPVDDPTSALWRCYTISGVDGDAYRISVKRDGAVSSLLHDSYGRESGLIVSGPFGDVTLDRDDRRPILLVSAGIGLTPTIAMLRALRDDPRPVHVVHVEREDPPAGLWREVESIVDALPEASVERYSTRGGTGTLSDGARSGRPSAEDIARAAHSLDAGPLAYICGPAGFYDDVRASLLDAGLDDASIRHEVFFSPSTAERSEPKPPPEPGPFAVRFTEPGRDDMDGTWVAERGSLLDVGESLGLSMPSGCRAGVCGSCALRVSVGSTAYVNDPTVSGPAGTVLLCSAVPTSDVTVELP